MKSAIIFVCSDQIGPYVNAISYLYDKHGIRQYSFVYIAGAPVEAPSTAFVEKLSGAFEALSNGDYEGREVDLSSETKNQYAAIGRLLDTDGQEQNVWEMNDLEVLLRSRAGRVRSRRLIIDITGLPKVVAAQVVLICLKGRFRVHTFELRERVDRSAPERSLYYSLNPGAFHYPLITDEPAVARVVSRLVPLRRVAYATIVLWLVAAAVMTILLFVDPSSLVFVYIGILASVTGIGSGVYQVVASR